jgi:chromosomal replication initiation ATPase DnaA
MALSDDIQLSQMFVKLFQDRQVAVDPKTIGYLVARMERSSAEAVALAELMDRMALERGVAITRNIAAEALARRNAASSSDQMSLDLEGPEGDDDE